MKEIIRDIIIAVVIALIIIQFVRPTVVKESSMEATLYANDYVFLNKQAYTLFGDPQRGDIIVFKSDLKDDYGKDKLLIKRVIGLPGEHVEIKDNVVYIDGDVLDEPYIREAGCTPGEIDEYVYDDSLFVMGDNRQVSIDSRYPEVGLVKVDDVVGVAFFRLFPISYMGKL